MSKQQDEEMNKLREQIKLLEELAELKEEMSNMDSRYLNLEEKINKQVELREKLAQQGLKVSQFLTDVDENLLKAKSKLSEYEKDILETEKERNKVENESNRTLGQRLETELKYLTEQSKVVQKEYELHDAQLQVLKANQEKTKDEKQAALNQDKRVKQLKEELEELKKIEEEQKKREAREKKSEESKKNSIGKANIPFLGSVSDIKSFSELSTSAKLFSIGAETFNTAVNTFTGIFTKGLNSIATNANNNFQNISVRSGMTFSTYKNGIASMGRAGGTLSNWNGYDLHDNIKTSEVQDMMNTLANTGMNEEQLIANAIDTVLTKNIVPYLELGTAEMQQFNKNTNGELMKQVRGIAKVNQEMFDGNEVATQYLQDQLTLLEPISSVAELDLIQNNEQMMAYYQQLRGKGMSDAQIAREIASVRKIQTNTYGTLQNGSLAEQLAIIQGESQGINFQEDSYGITTLVGSNTQMLANMGPSNGGLIASVYANSIGSTDQEQYILSNGKFNRTEAENKALEAGSRLKGASEEATQDFANGNNQTTLQKQEITLENLSSDLAMWKVDMGAWFDVLTTAVKGIATILVGWGISKIGGSLLKGITGKAGGSLVGSALTSLAGTSLGYQAMGIGASMGINSIPAATAAGFAVPAAIAAGGVAGGAYGISEGVKDWQNGHKVRGGISTVGGAAMAAGGISVAGGMLAAGAANAWNPVGWGLLIVGGLAVAGTAIARASEEIDITVDEMAGVKDNFKSFTKSQVKTLEDVKENLENNRDLETVRSELINSGILSEEDTIKAEDASREALIELTNQYITSKKELSGEAEAIFDDINKDINESYDGIRDFLANKWKDESNYGQIGDDEHKQEWLEYYLTPVYNQLKNKENRTDNENEFINRYETARSKDWKDDRIDDIIDESLGAETFFSDYVTTDMLNNYQSNRSTNHWGEDNFTEYEMSLIDDLYNVMGVNSKESAIKELQEIRGKNYNGVTGVDWNDKLYGPTIKKIMDYWKIESYRTGLDEVPYDNYLANLHQGEAVLTADTANELRNLIDEYRETKEDSAKIAQAIESQTTALIERLDAIYNRIPTSLENDPSQIMPGNLLGSGNDMNTNMRKMTTLYSN